MGEAILRGVVNSGSIKVTVHDRFKQWQQADCHGYFFRGERICCRYGTRAGDIANVVFAVAGWQRQGVTNALFVAMEVMRGIKSQECASGQILFSSSSHRHDTIGALCHLMVEGCDSLGCDLLELLLLPGQV